MSRERIVAALAAVVLAIVGTVGMVAYVNGAEERAASGELLADVFVVERRVPAGTSADRLADFTSQIVLVIWALANLALILMKRRGDAPPAGTFIVPMWVPVVGLITAVGLLAITSWP